MKSQKVEFGQVKISNALNGHLFYTLCMYNVRASVCVQSIFRQ